MTNREMLRELIYAVHAQQKQLVENGDLSIIPKVLCRLYQDQLVGVNRVIADESLSLRGRLAAYFSDSFDWRYGIAVAKLFGFSLSPEDALGYDVLKYTGDLRLELVGSDRSSFVRYLRNLGGKPLSKEISVSTDGVNHINIYSKSRNLVGQMTSNFYSVGGQHRFETVHGFFATLEGYYHYLRILDYLRATQDSDDDEKLMLHMAHYHPNLSRLAHVNGAEAIQLGRSLKASIYGGSKYRPGAFSLMSEKQFMYALVCKCHELKIEDVSLGNELAAIVNSGIPLLHYYVMQQGITTPPHSEWLPNAYRWLAEQIDPCAETFDRPALLKKVWDEYEPS